MKGSRVESIEEARKEYKKTIRGRVEKTCRFNIKKNGEQVLYLKIDIIKN